MKKVILKKLQIAHKDKRGSIMDLVNEKVSHVGIIVTEKGAIRANHYHKLSTQYNYVVSGKFEISYAPVSKPIAKKKIILKPGYLLTIPPYTIHSFKALEKTVLLDIISESRARGGYEKDVFRVEF